MSVTSAPSRITPADGERRLCSAISEMPGRVSASWNGAGLRPVVERGLELGEGHDLAAALDLVARGLHDAVQHAQVGASLPVSATSRSSACRRAALVDRRLGGAHALLQAVRAAGGVDRRARVEHREVTRRTRLAREDAPRRWRRWPSGGPPATSS